MLLIINYYNKGQRTYYIPIVMYTCMFVTNICMVLYYACANYCYMPTIIFYTYLVYSK